ncbi:hypothetical protein N7541_001486 [Penicillium brevicompactum]|uniref:Uncharacterized protein n=1 Tax=Penicillium brevicompactum TaxID=5074 RepID=A0A9W9Q7L9_PENBR|nr:uncharacterized protein N7506_000853 [Penicillium brevicompactum]KAJ5328375.1 hypothetical protein N7452_008765 [Penicillium brevicompactum]KAJ5347600.1 hypothetical protein N7506_000853 [Penicillium brevicompactum]KAJ5367545.1 hypothetical protein N7541_001486 [Penicillium brevicompactum]
MAEGQSTPQLATAAQAPLRSQKVSETVPYYRPSKGFYPCKKEPSKYVTSLDFDDQGDYLVGAGNDESIHTYDVKEGKFNKTVASKKYGVHLARFTHHSRQVLHASTKVDNNLRLLDLHNESYVRYFTGVGDQVTCLALSPASDAFISCSKDDTVTLWDLNSRNPQGKLNIATPYLSAFDNSGAVIAIASQSTSVVLLYDFRNFDKAPFSTFDLAPWEERFTPSTRGRAWTKLEFSNDGKSLLLGTDYHGHYVLDAYEGTVKAFLAGKSGSSGRAAPVSTTGKPLGQGDACFSPDGRYVVGGNGEQPGLLMWDINQANAADPALQPAYRLPYQKATAMVEWNPRYNMIASAEKEIVFWAPDDPSKSSEK